MTDRFILISPKVRQNAANAVWNAPEGYSVTIAEPKRSSDQNRFFHALCGDLARSKFKWAGKERSLEDWKALMVSAHSVATGTGGEIIPGIENEFVAIRESTSRMGVARANSLITYVLAFCDTNSIPLTATREGGFLEERAA